MGPELSALIALISGGGPYVLAAVFAYLWWSEREYGRTRQLFVDALLERVLNSLNGNANALGDLRVYLGLNRTGKERD